MKKFKTAKGYIAYKATAAETTRLGGNGVCDDCGQAAVQGFLVPVLNHYMFPACFHNWEAHGTFYPQDTEIESKNARYYEHRIPLDTEKKDWLSTRIELENAIFKAAACDDEDSMFNSITNYMQLLSDAICRIVNPIHEENASYMIAVLEATLKLIRNTVPYDQKMVEFLEALPALSFTIPIKKKE